MQDFWTFMLRCADGSYYVGHTDDIDVRIGQHQDGSLGGYTATRRPVSLVWSDRFPDRDSAFAAERQIKGWSRAKKEALIRGDWATLSQLAHKRRPFDRPAQGERVSHNSAHPEEAPSGAVSKDHGEEGLSSSRSERSEGPSRTTRPTRTTGSDAFALPLSSRCQYCPSPHYRSS